MREGGEIKREEGERKREKGGDYFQNIFKGRWEEQEGRGGRNDKKRKEGIFSMEKVSSKFLVQL